MLPKIDFYFLQIPTFYLVLSLTCTLVLAWLSKRIGKRTRFDRTVAFDLAQVIMVSGFLGGRALHVLYEEPAHYAQFPEQIFKFWNGGFVYFGGFLLAALCACLFLRYKKQKWLDWFDFFTPLISFAYALGRLGCFFEGCCYGKSCDFFWAVHGRHPTQIYMVIAEFLLLGFILNKEARANAPPGALFFSWLTGHAVCRFIIEFYRADDRGNFLAGGLSLSQIISFLVLIFSLSFLKKIQTNLKHAESL